MRRIGSIARVILADLRERLVIENCRKEAVIDDEAEKTEAEIGYREPASIGVKLDLPSEVERKQNHFPATDPLGWKLAPNGATIAFYSGALHDGSHIGGALGRRELCDSEAGQPSFPEVEHAIMVDGAPDAGHLRIHRSRTMAL